MKGRQPTKAERQHMDRICQLGCVVCRKDMDVFSPAEVHHITGKTTPDAHMKTIALCSRHHRIKSNDGAWVSRHGDGRSAFEARYGRENDLLDWWGSHDEF